MRNPILRAFRLAPDELVVDNFAGGGGASTGIESAIGRPVDIAINHDPTAIAMHQANHPETKHFCESVWDVDPRDACCGRSVGLAWFSPDCCHFSRAKGRKPVKKEIRGLAWVVIRWAATVKPRVIILENVEEFQTWGPLDEDGLPDRSRAGETFHQWIGQLTDLGYTVEFRSIVAADYGTPTTRKRLFLVAKADGGNASWPAPTNGNGRPDPWIPASQIIDWTLHCPSIFERKRPLAEATMRRIAAGLKRYVLDTGNPFIVPVTHQGDRRVHGIDEPVRTITTAHRGELALVAPTLIQTGYGERPGQSPRVPGLHKPLGTVVAGGVKHAVVTAFLGRYFGQSVGQGVDRPVPTITAGGQGKTTVVSAFLTKHYSGVVGHGVNRPIGTVTAKDHHALTCAYLTKFYGTATGAPVADPLPTVTSGGGRGGGHLGAVQAFLVKYYQGGRPAQDLRDPLPTVTTKDRFGLVTVHGEQYQIVDIGMRMLQPHELFAAQGFPDDYVIRPTHKGKPITKTSQVSLAGNSVCPQVAEALVTANVVRD